MTRVCSESVKKAAQTTVDYVHNAAERAAEGSKNVILVVIDRTGEMFPNASDEVTTPERGMAPNKMERSIASHDSKIEAEKGNINIRLSVIHECVLPINAGTNGGMASGKG